MNVIVLFLTVLAWVFALGSVLWMGIAMLAIKSYQGSTLHLSDMARKVKRKWDFTKPITIFLVCVAWLIAVYLSK